MHKKIGNRKLIPAMSAILEELNGVAERTMVRSGG